MAELSAAAVGVLAGLLDPDLEPEGVRASDEVWAELRAFAHPARLPIWTEDDDLAGLGEPEAYYQPPTD